MNKVERVLLDKEMFGFWSRCDPLATAILLVPQVATQIKQVFVSVELHGLKTRGAMIVDHLKVSGHKPNVTIIERVNIELYKTLLVEAFAPSMIKS
jgi:inosine-uridine nucleoside N-ribohydrolase